MNYARHYHRKVVKNHEADLHASQELNLSFLLDFWKHIIEKKDNNGKCHTVFVYAVDRPMKLTSGQQIYREQETGNCKDPIAAEDASDVEELFRFSVFYVHCFQGPHVLFALEKLLKIVIAIQIEALID